MATTWQLPATANGWVTDGGLETDLIFHRGIDLPDFASFPLLDDPEGRAVLEDYYRAYAEVAERAGAGLLLETPTWRANADWGARLGYDAEALRRVNRDAVAHLRTLARELGDRVVTTLVVGAVGPRGDGYRAGEHDADRYADYHRPQLEAFAEEGADLATAYTLSTVAEAVGVVRAAQDADLPVAISFTALTIVIADSAYYSEQREIVAGGGPTPDGVVVTSRAFETFLPQFPVILAIAVALFAFSTLITWSYYTMKAWTELFGRSKRSEAIFKIVFCLFTVIGSVMTFTSVLTFADSMLFVCAIVNLLACYILLPKVREELRSFREGRRTGAIKEVPVEERATT